jgi:hypothetical protein
VLRLHEFLSCSKHRLRFAVLRQVWKATRWLPQRKTGPVRSLPHLWRRESARFDKGDHRHYGSRETPYTFSTVERLIADFLADVRSIREGSR